jgi:hypothetical protein
MAKLGWVEVLALFGKPSSARLFDHLVGAAEQRDWTVSPSALAVIKLMLNSTFLTC